MKYLRVEIEHACYKLGLDLKENGARLVGLCPFHSETNGSFVVYPKTNSFYCYGCHVGGNTLKLVSSFVEGVKTERDLARWYGDELVNLVPVRQTFTLSHLQRVLEGETPVRLPVSIKSQNPLFIPFEIGYVERGPMAGRHIIPVYFRGKLIGYEARDFTSRQTPKTLIQPPEVPIHSYLWNYDNVREGEPIIVVEGIKGAIALLSYGIKDVVSSFRAQLSTDQVFLLLAKHPTEVVIAYDSDSAGSAGTEEAISQLLAWVTVSVVKLPNSCDPWDILPGTWQTCFEARHLMTIPDKNAAVIKSLQALLF